MKHKEIKESLFNTSCLFIWDCSEEDFLKQVNRDCQLKEEKQGSDGKFIAYETEDFHNIYVWIREANMISLAHELMHLTNYWLKFQGVSFSQATDEVYARFQGYYLAECLKAISKYMPSKNNRKTKKKSSRKTK